MYAGHFDFTVPMLGTVDKFWTPERCRELIERYASAEWLPATVNAAEGRVVKEGLRNNDLAFVRDEALSSDLFAAIKPHVPKAMMAEWEGDRRSLVPAGLFEPLRIYRYRPGQHFGLHQDQSYQQDGSRSLLTLMVYLDEGCGGGETDFPEQGQRIVPQTGRLLWFQHMLLHAGKAVTDGIKHVLRTDVHYGPSS